MKRQKLSHADGRQNQPIVERRGERELVAMRTFDAPPNAVYRAWSEPELFRRWWLPKSVPGLLLVSCDMDVRTGGKYRLDFSVGNSETVTFYGKYLDVVPNERIVWTNDEGGEGAVTTVTFEDQGETTLLSFHELYPFREAREEAMEGGAAALPEQLEQLGQLLSAGDLCR